jgi:hypothetical protein
LKQILKKSRLCWAICFLVGSVIGIIQVIDKEEDFKFSLSVMTMNHIPSKFFLIFWILEHDDFWYGVGLGKRDRIFADSRIKSKYGRIPLTGDHIVPWAMPKAGI